MEHLKSGFQANRDGAGFAVANQGKLTIKKGFFSMDKLAQAIEPHAGCPMLIHFRFATHGTVNKFNCHPWSICGGKYAMIHNGVLNIQSTPEKSDSGHFADAVLSPMIERMIDTHPGVVKFAVEQMIGNGNKIAVMGRDGLATIYNENAGVWDGGIWYSNTGYKLAKNHFSLWKDSCDYCGERLEAKFFRGYAKDRVCPSCRQMDEDIELNSI